MQYTNVGLNASKALRILMGFLVIFAFLTVSMSGLLGNSGVAHATNQNDSEREKIKAGAVTDYECGQEWHFTITNVGDEIEAPENVKVKWDDAQGDVPLSEVTDNTAHYRTSDNLTSGLVWVKAFINPEWDGEFNVHSGPCHENEEEEAEEPEPKPKKEVFGSINVCKVIVDGEGEVTNGDSLLGAFEISGLDFNNPSGVLPTSAFSTPIAFNTDVFAHVEGDDAKCYSYTDLPLGSYYYGEEVIEGDNWASPLYNDQHNHPVSGLDDFFPYSGELFTEDAGDDEERNTNSDGHIILRSERPDRTLIVLNAFEGEPAPYCGDGIVNQEHEECDGGDQCTLECTFEGPDNSCPFEPKDGRIIIDFEDGKKILDTEGNNYSGPVDTEVPAGTYRVSLASFDGYENRSDGDAQENERWTLHLSDVFEFIAASLPSTDLPDNVDFVSQIDVVNKALVVESDANSAKAWHVATSEDPTSPNSVEPVCAALDLVGENQKPVIELIGDNPILITVGGSYTDPGATASDFEDGDITADIVVGGDTVLPDTVGTYTVTYNVEDSLGLAADEVTRDVIVRNKADKKQCSDRKDNDGDGLTDKEDPGCHTDGDPNNNASYDPNDDDESNEVPYAPYCGDGEVNQSWESCDGGAECTVQCQFANQCVERAFARVNTNEFENHSNGDVTSDIFLGSLTNKIPGGVWFAIYDSGFITDPDISGYENVPGLAVERQEGKVRTLLFGSHPHDGSKEHINGDVEFFDVEVLGLENDTSGNNKLEKGFDGVMDNVPGQDEVWLVDGNDAQAFFWLTVTTADDAFYATYGEAPVCALPNQKPVITLLGDNPLIIELFGTYTDPGATAEDPEDGDITGDIIVGGDAVDPNTVGDYIVTYNVEDSEGLAADEVTRTVTVVDSGEPAECSDQADNDEDGTTDAEDAGCHTDGDPNNPLSYDPNDNDENEKPVITLTGNETVEITLGTNYDDEGATANDSEDGDITSDIVVGGDIVDSNTAGTYVITFNVTDSDGRAADEVTRTVRVINPGSNPGTPSTPGGGGGGPIPDNLKITNEKITVIGEGTALITWTTNKPATSRVIYDDDSHNVGPAALNFGTGDDFGYEFTTEIKTDLVTEHSVIVTNVNLEDTFYFRPISSDGTRAIGIELNAVLGVVTGGACEQYLFEFIRFGSDNNEEEVRKLQNFLNEFEGNSLEVTGVYDEATFNAVVAFQNKYQGDVLSPWGLQNDTGYVYLTTRKKINEIYCNFQLEFPLTADQQSEVNEFKALLESLEAQGLPLPDTSNVGFTPGAPTFAGDSDPNVTLTEETTDGEGEEGTDSLAAAIEALEGEGDEGGIINRIGNFLRNLFR